MDTAASSRTANFDEICRRCIINVEETAIPAILPPRSTVVKYTKIPDSDFNYDSKGNWSKSYYSLPPRFRRYVSLDDQTLQVSQSAKLDTIPTQNHLLTPKVKRKMVSISENNDIKSAKQPSRKQVWMHRGSQVDDKSIKTTARFKNLTTGQRDKSSDNVNHSSVSNSSSVQAKKLLNKNPPSHAASHKGRIARKSGSRIGRTDTNSRPIPNTDIVDNNIKKESNKPKSGKNIVISRKTSARTKSPKTTEINMHIPSPTSEKMVETISRRKVEKKRPPTTVSTKSEKIHKNNPDCNKKETKKTMLSPPSARKVHSPNVIRVPLNNQKSRLKYSFNSRWHPTMSDGFTEANSPSTMHAQLDTSSLHNLSDQYTDMQDFSSLIHNDKKLCDVEIQAQTATDSNTTQTDNNNLDTSVPIVNTYDSLNIPNVSLTIEKSNPNELKSLSLTNLKSPALTFPRKEENQLESKSYIISRAMVTYTTKQKFDIQVIGNQDSRSTSTSPITQYPLSVVSVLKRELQKCESDKVNTYCSSHSRTKSESDNTDCAKVLSSYAVSQPNLVKPSDLISGIKVNTDCFSDQFQMELNFIDSFFESLQYLESSSLTKKSLSLSKTETWINGNYDADNSDYNNFLSKLENDNDSQTMATNSLCLLNLLIRNEQKRAENLLVALKMREEALKDFTKSQILWLETKKKQENTDISTLKKKQRGALLKLQLECGEMHRMKKALLMLSDKRKAALMKTKKNLELKLTSSVDVDKILNKKKLRRPSSERVNVPLKCFELSSSGCEAEERPHPVAKKVEATTEKSIQTLDATEPEPLISTTTVSEHNVTVDGGFLNILFQDLKMPQIFSNGKQYEVNEEALKNILNSTKNESVVVSDMVEQFMDQMKKSEENTTTPSTARSLVDEMDLYYKSLADEDKVYTSQSETTDSDSPVEDVEDVRLMEEKENSVCEARSFEEVEDSAVTLVEELRERSQTGPLPVPVGAPVESLEVPKTHDESLIIIDESSNVSTEVMSQSVEPHSEIQFNAVEPNLVSPVDCEAERLRKQQMAIEKEIKALEQQQSQLLAVRSIPDKPPPPYTPPVDARSSRPRRRFTPDEAVTTMHRLLQDDAEADDSNPLEVYVKDFCEEAAARRKAELSEVPWDSCNLLPKAPELDRDTLVKTTAEGLKQVLTVVPPTTVTGLSTRRSDHIDNILFADWRRCESEWTSLHVDEAAVKNQVFESILQKLLEQTLHEYKRDVLGVDDTSGEALEPSSGAGQSDHCDH